MLSLTALVYNETSISRPPLELAVVHRWLFYKDHQAFYYNFDAIFRVIISLEETNPFNFIRTG